MIQIQHKIFDDTIFLATQYVPSNRDRVFLDLVVYFPNLSVRFDQNNVMHFGRQVEDLWRLAMNPWQWMLIRRTTFGDTIVVGVVEDDDLNTFYKRIL